MELFSEILSDLIMQKNLSLRKIAKEIGISSSQMSRYTKSILPTIDVAVKIANYFNCSLDYLCGLNDKNIYNFNLNYDMSKFLPRYYELLKENNTTHWKFCKKYGRNESEIRRWKNGEIPRLYSIIFIAENLGVSIDYLVGRSDKK